MKKLTKELLREMNECGISGPNMFVPHDELGATIEHLKELGGRLDAEPREHQNVRMSVAGVPVLAKSKTCHVAFELESGRHIYVWISTTAIEVELVEKAAA